MKDQSKLDSKSQDDLKATKPSIKQWIYGILAVLIILGFVVWTHYWITLLLIPVFIDIYITKKINWNKWKEVKNPKTRVLLEWVDAILFALVGIYFLNIFVIQNYQIPTSSLEKSLLVGDFLCVSKFSYGGRSPMTPFSLPLMQHTIPMLGTKSYLDNPQLDYQRFAGSGQITRNDIVVFNYPSGDTVALNCQDQDYYMLCKYENREHVWNNPAKFGEVVYRPVDRRENYVKRCIGLPGETIELKSDSVFIDGKYQTPPVNVEQQYCVQTDGTLIAPVVFSDLGMSDDDILAKSPAQNIASYDSVSTIRLGLKYKNRTAGMLYQRVNLTEEMVGKLQTKPFVLSVIRMNDYNKRIAALGGIYSDMPVYPIDYYEKVIAGDYPAIWIPKKGQTITFDGNVDLKVASYKRCIKNYEHNDFDYRDGKVYINGNEAKSYTFKFDYFFMMGDNRDNSSDSRAWGFVPEDHIVGKPLFIWLSLDKDKGWFSGKIRWNRIFTTGNKK